MSKKKALTKAIKNPSILKDAVVEKIEYHVIMIMNASLRIFVPLVQLNTACVATNTWVKNKFLLDRI